MSILCEWFGHRQAAWRHERASLGGGEYASKIRGPYVDGVGRQHFTLMVICPRCFEEYEACKVHGHSITERIKPAKEQDHD